MARDREKARARHRRYRQRRKIAKYGVAAADVDMRGRHGNHARGDANGADNRWENLEVTTRSAHAREHGDHPGARGPDGRFRADAPRSGESDLRVRQFPEART